MSAIIEQFLSMQIDEEKEIKQNDEYQGIWNKIQKQIDVLDEYRINKTLHDKIERNQDLINEMKNLMQIWQESKIESSKTENKENNFEQCFFEMPQRQLLQKQILLNLKEIQRYASKRRMSVGLLLPFDSKSIYYKTLMYIIKPPNQSTQNPSRPQTSFHINPKKIMKADISMSSNDDIVQRTDCGIFCLDL